MSFKKSQLVWVVHPVFGAERKFAILLCRRRGAVMRSGEQVRWMWNVYLPHLQRKYDFYESNLKVL
jgi:hypothetical protein